MKRLLIAIALLGLFAGPVAGEPNGEGPAWLRAEIERWVAAHADEPPARVVIPPLGAFAAAGPREPGLEIALSTHPGTRFVGRVPVTVALSRGGQEQRRGVVTVEVEHRHTVLVATRRLARGSVLREADVRRETRARSGLPEDALADSAQALGMRLRRGLAPGAPLRRSALEVAPLVRRGEAVRVRLLRGALAIEAVGQARDEGGVGDSVRVRNRDSGRELVGRVGPEGDVHVTF